MRTHALAAITKDGRPHKGGLLPLYDGLREPDVRKVVSITNKATRTDGKYHVHGIWWITLKEVPT